MEKAGQTPPEEPSWSGITTPEVTPPQLGLELCTYTVLTPEERTELDADLYELKVQRIRAAEVAGRIVLD